MLKKLKYGLMVLVPCIFLILGVMYLAPTKSVFEFNQWYYNKTNIIGRYLGYDIIDEVKRVELPSSSEYLVQIPNVPPTDEQYRAIGSILLSASDIRKVGAELSGVMKSETACNTTYLTKKPIPENITKEKKRAVEKENQILYDEVITIGVLKEKKGRLLEQGHIFGTAVDETSFDTCEKTLSDKFDSSSLEALMGKILSDTDLDAKIARGKEFIQRNTQLRLMGEDEDIHSAELISYTDLVNYHFRFRNDPNKWQTGVLHSENLYKAMGALYSQPSLIYKLIAGRMAISRNMHQIYALTLLSVDSKTTVSKVASYLEVHPIFTPDSLKKVIVDSVYEDITIAQSAPWYLRKTLLVDVDELELMSQMGGISAFSKFFNTPKPSWDDDGVIDPLNFFGASKDIWLRRNMLGFELGSGPKDSIYSKFYYYTFLEKDFVNSFK